MQDDGTNNFKSAVLKSSPSIYDDGTNAAINQLIMNNLPKTAKISSPTSKSITKPKIGQSVSGSAIVSKPKNAGSTYTPPKVVTPTVTSSQFFYPIASPGVQTVKNGGIDFTVPSSTPVYPSATGVVIFAGTKDSFGNAVFIYNDNNYITIFYNLATINVSKGDYVGDFTKSIGTASGTFHFEIRQKTDTGITVMNASKMLVSRTLIPQN